MAETTFESQSNIKPRVRLIQVHPKPESTLAQSLDNLEFDIIALHGLDAETPKTWIAWKEDGNPHSKHVNWLQDDDMLPSFVPNARILAYQWNARYDDAAPSTTFNSQAVMLLEDIYTERYFSKRKERPIIFIASCFGGLLLAKALVTAASPVHTIRSGNSNEILKYTIGAIFLGTPFCGSGATGREAADIRYEAALASGKACSPSMLQYLRQGSMHKPSELDELVKDFQGLISHHALKFEITCAYETLTTKISAYKKGLGDKYEEFARGRPAEFVIVDHNSARLGGTKELALDARHNMLHKFNSPLDSSFRKIVMRLQEIIEKSQDFMAQKDHIHVFKHRNSQTKGQKQEEWQTKCLEALDFDGIDYEPQQFREPGETACEWLIEDSSYSKWYNNGYGTFWILGHAGTGKSTLIKHAIKSCVEQVHQDQTVTLSFFFHNQGKLLQRTSEGLFRALLHQLLEKLPEQMKSFAETLDLRKSRLNQVGWEDKMSGTNLNESTWPTPYLVRHFEASVERVVERFDIRIFVDALDECKDTERNEDKTRDLYNLVLKMQEIAEKLRSKPRKFSICFACRHYPQLARLDGNNHVFAERGNRKDIEEYVCQELDREIVGEEHKQLRDTLKKEILRSADGNFLWVTIMVPKVLTLHLGRRPDLVAEVRKIPSRIEEFYATAISSLAKDTREISLKFFQWVCFATRPLEVHEIRFAINIIPDKRYLSFDDLPRPFWGNTDEDMANLVCTLSGGLAEVRNTNEVFFIHQSVKDYMISSGFYRLDSEQCDTQKVLKRGHDLLLTSCLWWIAESSMSKAFDNFMASFSPEIIHITMASLSEDISDDLDVHPDIEPDDVRREIDALSESDRQAFRECFKQSTTHDLNDSLPEEYSKGKDWSQFKEWLFVDEMLACLLTWVASLWTTPSGFGYMYAVVSWTDHAVQSLANGSESDAGNALQLGLDLFFSRAQPSHIFLHNQVFNTLQRAARVSNPVVLRELLERDVNRSLDVNSRSLDDLTPLMGASDEGPVENVKMLLERNDVEVNAEDVNGQTTLFMAIESERYSIVELLINKADLNHRDKKGLTALMYAVQSDQSEIMDLLLERGARTEIEDNNNFTAVDYATDRCFKGLSRYIIRMVRRQERGN